MVETKKPNLITTLEKSEPFTVKDIGTFWPLIISKEATVHYVEFVDIPPHYHTKTEERFHITEGGGIMEYGPFMTLSPRSQRMGLVEPIGIIRIVLPEQLDQVWWLTSPLTCLIE